MAPLFFGWIIVGAGTLNSALLLGLVFYGFGGFMKPLTQELGWPATVVALGFSLQRLESGVFAPLAGALIDRFGARRVGLLGTTIYGAAFVLFAHVEAQWEFLVVSGLIALGQSLCTLANFTTVLMSWFHRLRARAVSFTMAGTGAGALLVAPLTWIMAEIGWRGALLGLGIAIWVVGFTTTATLRARPQPYGWAPDGDPLRAPPLHLADSSGPQPAAGLGLGAAEATRTPAFWLLFLATLLFSFSNLGWIVLQFPALEEKGFSTQVTGQAVAAYGFASIAARLAMGWVGDRLGRGRLFAASFLFQGIGLGIFAFADSVATLLPYYAFYGVGHAAYVITSQTVVADYFGMHRFATIRGILGVAGATGGAIAPVLGAWLFELQGSYVPVFTGFALASALGLPAALLSERLNPARLANAPETPD